MTDVSTELERRLRALVDAFPVGIFVADAKGKLIEINEQAHRIWGVAKEVDSISEFGAYKAWWHDTGEPLTAEDWGMARALRFGEVSIGEVVDIERFDGTRATIINNAAPLRDTDGNIIGGVVAELDITEQKRIERELKEAKEQAEAASRAKDEFLATVSHELRTPLTSILGWARMIRMPDLEPDLFNEALESIERNARAQAQLIDDILDVSRIITGKLQLNTSNLELRTIVEAAMATVRPAAEAKRIVLLADLDDSGLRIIGDPERLQQIVWNLLANAVKFTPQHGHVTVALDLYDGDVRLRIMDDGQGIDPSFLPYVFERFRQADTSASRTHGGLGLGLSIVRHLVELHGGTIGATSRGIGRGATFEVRFPLSRVAPDRSRAAADEVPARLDGVRVLLVDDQPDTRRVIAAVLEHCGASVTMAASAAEAMTLLSDGAHDVLLSDIGMPGKDGYTMVRELRASQSAGAAIPAAALTAFARDEDRAASLAAGFQQFLAKPVEPRELLDVVVSLVTLSSRA